MPVLAAALEPAQQPLGILAAGLVIMHCFSLQAYASCYAASKFMQNRRCKAKCTPNLVKVEAIGHLVSAGETKRNCGSAARAAS